jgi:MoaA/NifB/PqqE/SkfB family radical SAM enzyme
MSFRSSVERAWRDNHLLSVLLELTYRCNLDCAFCYNDMALKGRPLRLEQYEVLLDELAAMNVLTVILSGGEPLSHPQFFEIGKMARDRGFVVRIKSNGHALSSELARRVRDEIDPFLVEVSLHGATAATHDRLTRVGGSFNQLIANIGEMRALGLRVKANSTLTRWNENELQEMFALAATLGIALQVDPEVKPRDNGDLSPLSLAPTAEGVSKTNAFFKARSERLEHFSTVPSHADAPVDSRDKHCGAGASNLAIDPYGNVLPCVQWRRPIGNLHEASIRELWNGSQTLAAVRDITVSVRNEVAQKASVTGAFAFCPGLAELQTGNPHVPGSIAPQKAHVHLPLLREAS